MVELDTLITVVSSGHVGTRVTNSVTSHVVITTRPRVAATLTVCNISDQSRCHNYTTPRSRYTHSLQYQYYMLMLRYVTFTD